jgi:hypothetical protein
VIHANAGLVVIAAPDAATGTAVAVVSAKVVHWAIADVVITELAAAGVVHETVAIGANGISAIGGGGAFAVVVL